MWSKTPDTHVHIHNHFCDNCDCSKQLEAIMGKLEEIQAEVGEIRTNLGDMATALGGIGTRIDTLINTINDQAANGITPEGAQSLLTELQGIRADQQAQEDVANQMANPPA